LGTTFRAIGRGLGSGTLDLSEASAVQQDSATASASVVANAVERNAASRTDGVTVFLCGESWDGGGKRGKNTKSAGSCDLCDITAAKSRLVWRCGIVVRPAMFSQAFCDAQGFRRTVIPYMNRALTQRPNHIAFGGSPWQPRRISGDRSPPW
jgi:hypothetical protein